MGYYLRSGDHNKSPLDTLPPREWMKKQRLELGATSQRLGNMVKGIIFTHIGIALLFIGICITREHEKQRIIDALEDDPTIPPTIKEMLIEKIEHLP